METGNGWKQQEKEIMGFASPPLMNSRFCHCLYMVVFKKYPGKLWTVGRLNGLWWKQLTGSTKTGIFICECCNICLYYRGNSKLFIFFKDGFPHNLVLHLLVEVYSKLKGAAQNKKTNKN